MGYGLTLEGVGVQRLAMEIEKNLPSFKSNDLHVTVGYILRISSPYLTCFAK